MNKQLDLKTNENISKNDSSKPKVCQKEKNNELFKQLKKAKSVDEKNKIIDEICMSNIGLIMLTLKKMGISQNGFDIFSVEDLMQEGVNGLLIAISKFDETKGDNFSTYAYYWIRKIIEDALYNHGYITKVSHQNMENYFKIKKYIREKDISSINELDVKQIAKDLNLSPSSVTAALNIDNITYHNSIDKKINEDDELTFVQNIASDINVEDSVINSIFYSELVQQLENFKNTGYLNPIEYEILLYRFGFLTETPMTLAQIGKIKKISRERVRQIQNNALRKLRKYYSKFIDYMNQ